MNKSELIDAVAASADLPKASAGRAIDAMIDTITASLQKDDPVYTLEETFKAEKLNLDQQKLATEVLNEAESKNLEKEKLATKIIQQGIN